MAAGYEDVADELALLEDRQLNRKHIKTSNKLKISDKYVFIFLFQILVLQFYEHIEKGMLQKSLIQDCRFLT